MPDDAHLPPGGVENSVDGDVTGSVVQAGGITGGVHIGDINLRTGAPVRTRYREQVKQIAPKELVNRDADRAELAAFATDPACAGSYALWRAPAWAGKSRELASEAVSASRTLSRADVEGAAKKALSKALIVVGQDDESRVPAKPIRSKPVDPKPAPDSGGRSAYDGVPVDQVDNCEQLVLLAREAIARGDRDRARDAATEAEILARKISNPVGDGQALVTLIKAAVAVDELDRLLAVAELITGHYERVQALTALMNAVADEDLARARAIGATAEAHARLAVSEIEQKQALLALVRAVVPIGDLDWAEALTESIPASDEHTEALYLLTEALTAKGNPDRAVQLAHTVPEPGERCRVLIGIAWSMMRAGDRSGARELVARVTTIASTISQVGKRFQTLVKLIGMTAATDGPGHVDRLITEAEALIDLVDETTWERSRLIQTVAMAEGLARAETLAGSIVDPHRRHVALTELRGDPPTKPVDERPALQAEPSRRDILIAEGFFDQAAQLIRAIPDPDSQCVAWVAWARHAGPAYCTEAIVAILNQQRWPKATGLIAEYEPAVLAVLVDELLAIATPTPKSPA